MPQTIFSGEMNDFCRKFLVLGQTPEPSPSEFLTAMDTLQRALFENLLLFEKISMKVYGECIAVPLLINLLGEKNRYRD